MSLILRKTSQWWYGYFRIDGKEKVVPLGIQVEGQRPASLSQEGDSLFEQSRGRALAEHDRVKKELMEKRNLAQLTRKLIEIKTGEDNPLKSVPLSEFSTRWAETREKRKGDTKYAGEVKAILNRFAEFMKEQYPKTKELLLVRPDMTKAFMAAEEKRGVSPATWNYTLKQLRSAFRYLEPESPAYKDHLLKAQVKEKNTIHHQPFTPEDLKLILDAARDEDFIRPIIVTGICTAMRRADCCQLKWESVDLRKDVIFVKTEKTGAVVGIPIFPLLRKELVKRKKDESEFVFPEQAAMMDANPDGITLRVQQVLEKAGFKDKVTQGENTGDAAQEPQNELEARTKDEEEQIQRGQLRQVRQVGLRRASVRGFHSFRTTWITLALSNGVPMEVVRMVTGHETVETVLKHYFRPGPEQFRAIIHRAMPELLVGKGKTREEEMLEIARSMTGKTWKQGRKQLMKLLEQARPGSAAFKTTTASRRAARPKAAR